MDDLTIKELQKLCFKQAEKSGWNNPQPTFSDMIALIHSEASEAFEEYRKGKTEYEIYYNEGNPKPEGIPIEFADIIIRIAHYAEALGFDLEKAIDLKMEYNATRPYRQGNKKA